MKNLEGTSITELLDSGRFKIVDILFEGAGGSFWGWLIHFGIGGYYNHIPMVCAISGSGLYPYKALVIDHGMGGTCTMDISDYFEKFKICDLAVKRLERNWFQHDSKCGEVSFHKIVSDFALRRIVEKTAVTVPLGSAGRMLRRLPVIYRFVSRNSRSPRRRRRTTGATRHFDINTYACDGVVQ